jgi:hypothetical protein
MSGRDAHRDQAAADASAALATCRVSHCAFNAGLKWASGYKRAYFGAYF